MISAGHVCGSDGKPVINNMPTGIVRASMGAMSTEAEVDALIAFVRDTFVVSKVEPPPQPAPPIDLASGAVYRLKDASTPLFSLGPENVFELPYNAKPGPMIPLHMDAVLTGH